MVNYVSGFIMRVNTVLAVKCLLHDLGWKIEATPSPNRLLGQKVGQKVCCPNLSCKLSVDTSVRNQVICATPNPLYLNS